MPAENTGPIHFMAIARHRFKGFCLVAVIVAGGCATQPSGPTGYVERPRDTSYRSYGYKDKKLGPEEFSIFVAGNPRTQLARTKNIAMLRAARLAKERGYAYFAVLTQLHQVEQELHHHISCGFKNLFACLPEDTYEVDTPISVVVIKLLPPGSAGRAGVYGVVEAEKQALSELAKP